MTTHIEIIDDDSHCLQVDGMCGRTATAACSESHVDLLSAQYVFFTGVTV